MNLTFTKNGSKYVAEASVTADFNIHIEVEGEAQIVVSSSAVSNGKKQPHFSAVITDCFDHDFDARVYPKYLSISCTKLPTKGIVTEVG